MVKFRFKRSNSLSAILFVGILVASSLFFTGLCLDYTLSPRFFILSFLLGVFLLFQNYSKIKTQLSVNVVHIAFILFVFLSILSFYWAQNKAIVWFVDVRVICGLVVFFVSTHFFERKHKLIDTVSVGAIIMACVIISVGLLQYLDIPQLDSNSIYQITAINSHKNLSSSILFLLLSFIIYAYTQATGIKKWLIAALILCIMLSIYILRTRTVWIALAIIPVIAIVIHKIKIGAFKRKSFVIGIVIGCATLVVLVNLLLINYLIFNTKSVGIFDSASAIERVLVWKNTFMMIKEYPWLGVGLGNWQVYFPKYSLDGIWRCDELNFTFQRPHNDFLWILSETGIIGFALYIIVIMGVALPALRTYIRSSTYQSEHPALLLFLSFYFAGGIIAVFDFPNERAEHIIWLSILMAFLYTRSPEYYKTYFSFKFRRIYGVGIAAIILFGSYISFLQIRGEYHVKQMYLARDSRDAVQIINHAQQAISFAYSLDPVSIPIYWYSANALATLQMYNKSKEQLTLAYRAHPYNRFVINDLGTSYIFYGKLDSAKLLFTQASKLSPRYDEPKLNLVSLYILEGNFQKAIECEKTLLHDSERRNQLKETIERETLHSEN